MTTEELKDSILAWCENRLKKPVTTSEMKDISEIYDNIVKQETMVKMTESLSLNNCATPMYPNVKGDDVK